MAPPDRDELPGARIEHGVRGLEESPLPPSICPAPRVRLARHRRHSTI